MNSTNNKWIYVLLISLVLITSLNLWISTRSSGDREQVMQRDSILQTKIDSISQDVNDFRELYGNDRLLSDAEQKIINNYTIYEQKKDKLLNSPADSIYNWTKHRLSLRTK